MRGVLIKILYRLNSLLLPDLQSESIKRFTDGQRDIPKKPIVDVRSKDTETQRYYFRAIIDYLKKTGYTYEPSSSYRQITSMQFELAFKHIVNRIFPGHIFNKRLDVNVKQLADDLGYAYTDQVIKALPSLGALHTSATMYAFLHFLMNFAKAMDMTMPEDYHDTTSLQIDASGLATILLDDTIARRENNDHVAIDHQLKDTFGENICKCIY